MTATFIVAPEEFREGLRMARRKLPKKIKWFGYLQCASLFSIPIVIVVALPRDVIEENHIAWLPLVVLAAAWLVLVFSGLIYRALSQIGQQEVCGPEFFYEINDTGVHCNWKGVDLRLAWERFIGAAEGKHVIILREHGTIFYTLPKRAFEDLDGLRSLVRKHIPAARLQS